MNSCLTGRRLKADSNLTKMAAWHLIPFLQSFVNVMRKKMRPPTLVDEGEVRQSIFWQPLATLLWTEVCKLMAHKSAFATLRYHIWEERVITCERGSAKHSVKDDHAFPWKHAIFRHLPSRNPSTDQNARLIMSERLRDVPKIVIIG
jgi:hypothetical protein